jgi:hypothetical protein
MARDLRLLPFDSPPGYGLAWSHTILSCDRTAVLGQIRKIRGKPVPLCFESFVGQIQKSGEHRYGLTLVDPYGDPMRCVKVSQLLNLARSRGVTGSQVNRAVWAYLAHLDLATMVALYWH